MIKKRNKGFLLIEVLTAVTLLGFSVMYLSRALRSCLNAMLQFAHYTTALILAEEKFFNLETVNKESDIVKEGRFYENADFSYRLEVYRLSDLELNQADLDVQWKDGRRFGVVNLVCYFAVKK